MNFGAVYENVVAQELSAHGYKLFYFNNKKQGELDFLIEQGGKVIPIEVKSGKDYKRHAALCNVLKNPRYDIEKAYVFCNENLEIKDKKIYLPMYMLMCVKHKELPEKMIYKPDLSGIDL